MRRKLAFRTEKQRLCAVSRRELALLVATTILTLVLGSPASAAVTKSDLAQVEVSPPADATLPPDVPLQDEDETTRPLRRWLAGKPSVLVLADYTCKTLCGPVIAIVSDALVRSGLRSGEDFRLVVVGLDPKDTAADAAAMKQAQIGADNPLSAAAFFLHGDASAIAQLTKVLGFRSVYDRDRDQFAHPAAAFVITPDGRLSRTLPGLAANPETIRLAVIEAGNGTIGTWADHVRLLCYGFDPANGVFTVAIGRVLAASATVTILTLTLLIGLLLRRERLAR